MELSLNRLLIFMNILFEVSTWTAYRMFFPWKRATCLALCVDFPPMRPFRLALPTGHWVSVKEAWSKRPKWKATCKKRSILAETNFYPKRVGLTRRLKSAKINSTSIVRMWLSRKRIMQHFSSKIRNSTTKLQHYRLRWRSSRARLQAATLT